MRSILRFAAVAVPTVFLFSTGMAWILPVPEDDLSGAADERDFRVRIRPGAVDLEAEYDLTDLEVPLDRIHRLLPKDAIPSLTDPAVLAASESKWLDDDARIIDVEIGGERLGVPLLILDNHEIVNVTLGGEPVAVTYCPLCDSATVFSRRIASDPEIVAEFGVSGALYNSNVLMYDRTDKALWSQLGMRALSGPRAGTTLKMYPVKIVPMSVFRSQSPDAPVVSDQTGHQRNYRRSPYGPYFQTDALMVPVEAMGNALPRKTLGVGITDGQAAWFVPKAQAQAGVTVETPSGQVIVQATAAGMVVTQSPENVRTAQSFYYSWSAFYPNTQVVGVSGGKAD